MCSGSVRGVDSGAALLSSLSRESLDYCEFCTFFINRVS